MSRIRNDKIRGKHKTMTEAAEPIVSKLCGLRKVSGISLGNITNRGGRGGSDTKRVKIIDQKAGIRLAVSGNSTDQDLHVYLKKEAFRQPVKLWVARFVRDHAYDLSFHDLRCAG